MRRPPILLSALFLATVPLVQCGHTIARRNAKALEQIQVMRTALLATNRDAFDRFTSLQDYPEIHRAFGTESLDPGTPLGPNFQESLNQMIDMVLARLAKEEKDAYFLGKASKEVRRFGTWWRYQATMIQGRVDYLKDYYGKESFRYSKEGKERFELGMEVLEEIVNVLRTYEGIVEGCARRIEALQVRTGGW